MRTPEEKQAELLAKISSRSPEQRRPWMKYFGWAKDDPIYDEAMSLGAEWRRSQNQKQD